jgi:glycosyltransferase involved in cell wall biosynthesis
VFELNILMVTTFYPPHIGGIEYHVEALSKHLAERGHRLTILTSKLSKKESLFQKLSDNIDIFRVKTVFPSGWPYPALSSQGFVLNARRVIRKIACRKSIDLIHAHGHHYYLSWSAIDAARALDIPSVLTLHGLYALNPNSCLAKIGEEVFNRIIFRRELGKASAIIGLTPSITAYARKYGPLAKHYFTIPNGVNNHVFNINRKNRLDYRKKYGIGDDKIVVLFRGRFASVKGVCELAEASKLVVKKNKKVFFIFVGGGPLLKQVKTILHSMKQNSLILDWSPIDEIQELYIASDLFVLPSKSEALPLTILEAMATQLHIIVTPVGGIPEVLQEYPYKTYLSSLSPEILCDAILEVVDADKKRSIESQKLSGKLMANFDWRRITSQTEEVYIACG